MIVKKSIHLFYALFIPAFFLLPFSAFAKIEQWDFQNPIDYRYEPQKIKVGDGTARLLQHAPYRDNKGEAFDRGTYQGAWAPSGAVEPQRYPLEEKNPRQVSAPLANQTPGLLALWHFDEPSGTHLLDEINRNVAKGSDLQVVSGQTNFQYARQFDGHKSHVFIPHYQRFELKGPFTLEAWVRPGAVPSAKPQTILSRWQSVGSQKVFALQINPEGKIDFLVSSNGSTVVHHLSESAVAAGFWYHVAAVFTGSDLRIHLNGVLDGEPTPFRDKIYQAANPMYLGALVDNRIDELFRGSMDEVAIYDRVLSEMETLSHAGNAEALVALWHLNERGGVLMDRSGLGHNAIAHGNPEYEAEGKLGSSLHFDGKDQFLETPETFRFGPNDELTLEAWIKPDKLPYPERFVTLLSGRGEKSEYVLSLVGPEGRLRAFAPTLTPAEVISQHKVVPDVWQHAAVTWSKGTVRLYLNGLLDTSAPYHGVLETGKTEVRLGMDFLKTAPFKGSIDEVAIYRRAKSAYEMAKTAGLFSPYALYESSIKDAGGVVPWQSLSWKESLPYGDEFSTNAKGLVHLYHLNEPDGQILGDSRVISALHATGTYEVPGLFSRARWFAEKGSDKMISEREIPSFNTFTVSFWFQFASPVAGASDRLFSIGDENPSMVRAAPDGRLHVMAGGQRKMTSASSLTDTHWHHAALSSDGQQLFLYLDGVLNAVSPFTTETANQPLVLGNLKSSDTFQGAIDEFAFFNYALAHEEIWNHFLAGKLDLRFLVRSSQEAVVANAPWYGPRGVQKGDREASVFTIGLWHFNEGSTPDGSLKIADASRYGHHAAVYGNVSMVPGGILDGGLLFNGSTDFLEIPDSEIMHLTDQFTLSGWVRPFEMTTQDSRILDKHYHADAPVFSSFALELTSGNRLALKVGRPGGYQVITTDRDGEIAVDRWNHVAATYDGKEIKLFINGKLKKSSSFDERIPYDGGALFIGRSGGGEAAYFNGLLDEVGIENQALSDEEILSLYQRADPENFYRRSELEKLKVAPGRYFQYQAHLSTDYFAARPLLASAEVRGASFPTDLPFISNNVSVSYAEIQHFAERPGKKHGGALSYQFSNDGSNWFYHNGRHWVLAADPLESNTAAQAASRIRDFAREVGIGSFYFKAFLHSPTGLEPAELDAVEVDYLPNKLTVLSPNGGEAWLVGSQQQIVWSSTGEVQQISLEYSKDNFEKDFQAIARDIANTGAYAWKVPDDLTPQARIRVSDISDPRIYDKSDTGFRIIGAFEVVSPNYAERWAVDSEQEISWRTLGAIPQVKLEYSTDEFEQAVFPIVDSVENEGRYDWKIPDLISPSAKVRVSDVRDPLTYDQSNDTFAIVGTLSLVSPQAKMRWAVDSEQEIRWQTLGNVPSVKIEYSLSENNPNHIWRAIEDAYLNRGVLLWKVPDAIDPAVRIRISDVRDKQVAVESPPFAVTGGLKLLLPKGGEKWTVGSRRKIAWQTRGTVPAVYLKYARLDSVFETTASEDSLAKVKWQTFGDAIPNTGSFAWDVPDEISERVVIRIVDAKDSRVMAQNQAAIQIIPGFVLKVPNGNESWKVGSEVDLLWETKGSIPYVKLEYSKDRFVSDLQTIIPSASNIGRFAWKVPDDPAKQIRVRVSDPSVPEASDLSDVPFRVFADFKIKTPHGGEKFEVGSIAPLAWKTLGTVPQVRLEFSGDDFAKDIRVISESTVNRGQFNWTVPDNLGAGYRLRILDVRDPEANVVSKGEFSIVGSFHLTVPAGGENVMVGTSLPISWKGAGSIPYVRIDYSEDHFKRSFVTLAETAPNTGAFDWVVPNRVGQTFKIRIWDPAQPETMFIMEKAARIIGGFTLNAPNGGEVLFVGEPFEMTWQTHGSIPRVKLEFSGDHFNHDIQEIADTYENLGRYKWNVPDTVSGSYRIRISDPSDVTAYDLSNADFRIRSRLILKNPVGGEGWAVGETKAIEWQTSGYVPEVALEYSTDGFKSSATIAANAPNTGRYEWTIPDHVSLHVQIRVSDAKDPAAAAISKTPFRIQGILTLTAPNGGESWRVGQANPITWTTRGNVPAVRLEYSRDGFVSEAKVIAESVQNTGFYSWTAPDDLSPYTQVRVMDASDFQVRDVSNQVFQLAASFMMMSPNGGEVWHATEKREIDWVTVGTVPEVNLAYCVSKDHQAQGKPDCSDQEWTLIDRGILNAGRYLWDIPRLAEDSLRIKVCDTQSPSVCDISDGVFAVRSPLEIVYPRGGEVWPVASNQEIRWNTYGRIDRVLVQYAVYDETARNQKLIWKKMAEELENQGHFLFKVPDNISKKVFFRVADWEDDSIGSHTREPVKFVATFKLLTPNGGEKWAAGTTQKIAWDTLGSAPNVRLEYSNDDFIKDVRLIESSYANKGYYEWRVPSDLGVTIKVRVMDAHDPSIFDASDSPFKVMAGFTLVTPNGDESWVVGSKQKIQWKIEGRADAVRLEYAAVGAGLKPAASAESTLTWDLIAEKVPNAGEFEWTIPNRVSQAVLVRLTDDRDGDASDISDQAFEIRSDILMIAPNGSENLLIGVPYKIRWATVGAPANVRIEYSKDNFQKDLRLITASAPDQGFFFWTPTDDVTEAASIRVISSENAKVTDVSDKPFKILPSIKVLSPAAGDQWTVGDEKLLKWDWRGSLDLVKLEYSTDDFASSKTIAENVPNTGNYKWKIPDAVGPRLKIRVSAAKHPETFSDSEGFVKVRPGFKIVGPNGGEKWTSGERETIQWETAGTSPRVQLDYGLSENGKWVWKPVTEVLQNTGRYEWTLPPDVSAEVKARVSDVADAEAFAESRMPFKILASFKFLGPQADEVLLVGDKYQIRWETTGRVPSVKLEFLPAGKNLGMGAGAGSKHALTTVIEPAWLNNASYYWTVPDAISEEVWLRVSDTADPDASYESDKPFKIRGKLELQIPEGKNNWPIGSVQTLKWKTWGSIPNVNLEYSADGETWKPIAKALPNAGSYGWTIPDDASLAVKFRISDFNNEQVFHESASSAVFATQFHITSPAAGDRWIVESEKNIQWKSVGHAEKIWLEYSAGGEWKPLAGPIPDQGTYAWKVPDQISPKVQIRVRDGDNAEAFDASEPFAILGALEFRRPLGGDVWKVGTTQLLEWKTTGTIPTVRLEGWTEGEKPQSFVIADSLANQGKYEWQVPDRITNTLKFKVADRRDVEVSNVSRKGVSVIGNFELLSPRGGEVWRVNEDHEIVWTTQGTVPEVVLEYSRDDFYHDINVIASGVPNTGAALWKIQDAIGDYVKIRLSDARDTRTSALSQEAFKIAGALALKIPAGGEIWRVGSHLPLEWTTQGTIAEVRLEFSRDDFTRDIQVMENTLKNTGRYEWTLPDIVSSTFKVRVSNPTDPSVFSVSHPSKVLAVLKLKSPKGGEILKVLETYPIKWDTVGTIEKIRLEYSRDDFTRDIHVIKDEILNQGEWEWTVPDAIGRDLKIRVMNARDFAVADTSQEPFEIRGHLSLLLGDKEVRWPVGSRQAVSWSTLGSISHVRLAYSKDEFFKDVHVITDQLPNQGKWVWTIPDDISDRIRVRVLDYSNADVFSDSLAPIHVVGALKLTEPKEKSLAAVGTDQTIRWTSQGTVPAVRIEYSTASSQESTAGPWKLVAGALDNAGVYPWRIPDDISDTVRLRLSEVHDPLVYDISEKPFSITGKLEILNPEGAERWVAGTRHDLTWKTMGTIPEVKLEYSRDQFRKDIQLIAEKAANTGRFAWEIPDAISDQIRIRITDTRDQRVRAVSREPLSIIGGFVFLNPAGSSLWKVGSDQRIEWQTFGSIKEVRLEYFVFDAEAPSRSYVIQDRIQNHGQFLWNVPDTERQLVKLRLSDASNPSVSIESEAPIKLQGIFRIQSPLTPQKWQVGSTQELTWQTRGLISEVRIEASRDEFKKEITVLFPFLPNSGSVRWDVTDLVTKNLQIRVVDINNPEVFALTSAPIEIQGVLRFLTPAQGERWEVGSQHEIRWETLGTIPFVRLEYAANPAMREAELIHGQLPNRGQFLWTVPDAIAKEVWIRVRDTEFSEAAVLSEPFGVHGRLVLEIPAGGEIWTVGDEVELKWSTSGTIPTVRLEYSIDDFIHAFTIHEAVSNHGHYDWKVPDIVSDRLRVRVTDLADLRVFSASRLSFKVQGGLGLMSPQGAEFFRVGTQKVIAWKTAGSIPFVNLEYSKDNFSTSVRIIQGLQNTGSYVWTVPDLSADALKIKISNANDQAVFDATKQALKVGGALELLTPGGGETWRVGEEQEIRWNTIGTIAKVRLEISGDQFRSDIRALESALSNQGSYLWKVPDWIHSALQVRVSDAASSLVHDQSKAAFKIAGDLRLVTPQGGEVWRVGARVPIRWQTAGNIKEVSLEYSQDNFRTSLPIAVQVLNKGVYEWEVPDLAGSAIQIRVSDAEDPTIFTMTTYSIPVQGALALTSPKGGEIWQAQSQQLMTWQTTGTISNVNLEYIADELREPVSIASNIANTGSFLWTLPDLSARNLKIRVVDSVNTDVVSELALGVQVQGKLDLMTPQGGEVWLVGTYHPITWSSVGAIEKVRLECSADNFKTILPVAIGAANEGKWLWEVPDLISKNVRLRVIDANQSSVMAESKGALEIRGALSLTNPVGGEMWAVASRHAISWQSAGTLAQVQLEYSTDRFVSDVELLSAPIANRGVYYWEVPSLPSAELSIRVADVSNPDVYDISRGAVQLVGNLKLIYPDGGETFRVGDRLEIQWQATSNIQNVKLEYSMDDFETSQIISAVVPNTGKFVWHLPDAITDRMRLRVSDAQNATVFAMSRAPLLIRGALSLISPKGDRLWPMGSAQTLAWDTFGTIPEVRLEYSADDFETAFPIALKVANTGRYEWNVPELTLNHIRLRLSDARDPMTHAVTQGKIRLVGRLELLTPTGGERWVTNEERSIRWRTVGYISKVNLEYSKDNFERDVHLIASELPNVGSYLWTIPNDRSYQARVRVVKSEDSSVVAVSRDPFQIDHYQVRWILRDARTHDHLTGVQYGSTSGSVHQNLASPTTLEYPYGIYTTVWSKAGYEEFRSTWLADKDQSFTVDLEPGSSPAEEIRAHFEYDAEKDMMRIVSWMEKEAKPLATVIQSEVHIYDGSSLIESLRSSNPDSQGRFQMVWDTSSLAGNRDYLASTSITTAAGKTHTSSLSYQLKLPVKGRKEPVVRQAITSTFLKPLGVSREKSAPKEEKEKPIKGEESVPASAPAQAPQAEKAPQPLVAELLAPSTAALQETISIHYRSSANARPVLDIYDANRKLMMRGVPMETTGEAGKFSYLLAVRGMGFVPGKSITVTVIDRESHEFKTAAIQIQSLAAALGLEKAVGSTTVLEVLNRLDRHIDDLRRALKDRDRMPEVLASVQATLSQLVGEMSERTLERAVLDRLNRFAEELAKVVSSKGYDVRFLLERPLADSAGLEDVNDKMRQIQSAVAMLERLYYYSVGRTH